MRGFFARNSEAPQRILLIESAPRQAAEQALARLYAKAETGTVDVLSCYAEVPKGFDGSRGSAYFVHSSEAVAHRWNFVRKFSSAPYDAIAMVSTGSAVMRNWKWTIALRSRARIFLIDDAGEFLPFSIHDAGSLWRIVLYRSRVESLAAIFVSMCRLATMPFVIAYLMAFTVFVHVRRWLRSARGTAQQLTHS